MKWLLLIITFTGPTSPDKIDYEWHVSRERCETEGKKAAESWREGWPSYVCIPFTEIQR